MPTCSCGYDNTPGGDSQAPAHCEGCGTPLSPSKDQEPPAPGQQVPYWDLVKRTDEEGDVALNEWGEPLYEEVEKEKYIVDDDDREEYPELENVLVIHELQYHWGRGIGAERHGYITTRRVQTIELEEPCPECGHELTATETYVADPAGVYSRKTVECNVCDGIIVDHQG